MKKLNEFWQKVNKKQLAILLLIFLLAFGVRAHLMRYDLMWGFDSYYHARIGAEVVKNLAVPESDPLAYYFLENPSVPKTSTFFWLFTAAIYKVFTLGAPYDKELWIVFVKVLPALFGALISVAMYFLGKEMYDERAGIIMAFFASVVPSFVYRTMAGFFEEDSLGFLWLVIGFVFFVRAIKPLEFNKTTIKNGLISGLFFGIMAWTWGMFLIIPLVMSAYFFWTLILFWFKNQSREKIFEFVKIFAVSFLMFSFLAVFFVGTEWVTTTINYVVNYAPVNQENIERPTAAAADNVLAVTVGEENTGRQFFGEKYNALIIFPILALIFIPIKLLGKRKDHVSLLIFFWIALTLFMAWNKLKFTYTFGLPIAAAAGFVFSEIFYFLKTRTSTEKKFVGVALAFMLLIGIGAASIFTITKVPNIEQNDGWKETLYWIKDNTPVDAKMFNWWDQGHWISFVAERGVLTDNRNFSLEGNMAFANFIINENVDDSFALVKEFGSDYVVINSDNFFSLNTIALYAYNTINFNDPRVTRFFGVSFPCNQLVDPLTNQTKFVCGPNTLSADQMKLIPTKWLSQPNQFIDERVPGFLYKSPDNSSIFILNPASNNTVIAKLWFNSDEIKKFEEVYHNKNVKLFKIIG